MENTDWLKKANELARQQAEMQKERQRKHRRLRREITRRLEQFLDYASAGNLMAMENILRDYQKATRDNK